MFNRAKAKQKKATQPELNVYEQIQKISKLHLVSRIKACDGVEKARLQQEIHDSVDALEALYQELPDNPILVRVYAATFRILNEKEQAVFLLGDVRKLNRDDASLALAVAAAKGEDFCQWVNSQVKLQTYIYSEAYHVLAPYFATVSSICYANKINSIEKAFALLIQSILDGMSENKSEALKTLTESENTFKTMKATIPKVISKVRESLHNLWFADAFRVSVMTQEQVIQHNLSVHETLFAILERSLKFVLDREREFLIEHISANQQPFVTARVTEPNTIEKKASIDSTASDPTAYASSQESAIASLSTQHEMTPALEEPKSILEIAFNSKKRKAPASGLQDEKEPPTKKGRLTVKEPTEANNSAMVHRSSTYTSTANEGFPAKTLIINQVQFVPTSSLGELDYSQVAFERVKPKRTKQNSTKLELSAILKNETFQKPNEPTSSLIEEETNELMRVEITGSNTKKSIGRWGEEFVLGFLEHHYRQKYPAAAIRKEPTNSLSTIENPVTINIDWRNRDNEQFQPIDIVVTKITKTEQDREEVKTRLIEVKTSVNNSADITLSGNEVALMKKYGKAYSIFRVTNAGGDAKITKIRDPWNSIEKEALPIKSITMKL